MRKYHHKVNIITMFAFLITTFLSTSVLFPTSHVSATAPSVTDEINLTVPVSCSLSGTGMDSHVATLQNGHSNSTIGESNITAYCNDINGFSIYAVGFTNNEYGNNHLVSTTASGTSSISTGTNTSGDTSSWAMKLTPITNPTPTYPITIIGSTDDTDKTPTTLDYTSFQSVPNEYALVARRKASTDIGSSAEGSSFKTTYQAYAASGQAAGTYEGQVKYTLIHPYHEIDSARPNQYYVVHSGTGEIEVLPLSDDGNLTTKVAENFLYGGYYKAYGGVSSEAVNNAIAQYENGDENALTIDSFKPYTLENMGELENAWNIRDAYTELGNAINPEKGAVYYLKEVPDNYLRAKAYYLWYRTTITEYFPMSVIDDLNYRKAGYIITPNEQEIMTDVYDYINVTNTATGQVESVIRPHNIVDGLEYGYILHRPYFDLVFSTPGETIHKMFLPFYVTPDKIRIVGRLYIYATIEDTNNDGILNKDEYKQTRYTYAGQIKVHNGESYVPPLTVAPGH